MNNDLAPARAHETAALSWLADYNPRDGHGPVGQSDGTDLFTREVVLDAFEAGVAEHLHLAILRGDDAALTVRVLRNHAAGMTQLVETSTLTSGKTMTAGDARRAAIVMESCWNELGEARALLRDAATVFRAYEKQHADAAWAIGSHQPEWKCRKAEADRNGALAAEIEVWLRGGDGPGPLIPANGDYLDEDVAIAALRDVIDQPERLTPQSAAPNVKPVDLAALGGVAEILRQALEPGAHPVDVLRNYIPMDAEAEAALRQLCDEPVISPPPFRFQDPSVAPDSPERFVPIDPMRGRPVAKVGGDYEFEGVIQTRVVKNSGEVRYVVEDDRGLLLILNARQVGLEPYMAEIGVTGPPDRVEAVAVAETTVAPEPPTPPRSSAGYEPHDKFDPSCPACCAYDVVSAAYSLIPDDGVAAFLNGSVDAIAHLWSISVKTGSEQEGRTRVQLRFDEALTFQLTKRAERDRRGQTVQ